jgi:hypothetical protein
MNQDCASDRGLASFCLDCDGAAGDVSRFFLKPYVSPSDIPEAPSWRAPARWRL